MRNFLKTAALSALLTAQAGASTDQNDVPDIKPGALIHFCEPVNVPTKDKDKDANQGIQWVDIDKLTGDFNASLKQSIPVSAEEISSAKKKEAEKTLETALAEIGPGKLDVLKDRIDEIKLIYVTKPPTASVIDGLNKEVEILAELQKKQSILDTLVTKDKNGVIQVLEIGVYENTVRKTDVLDSFEKLKDEGMVCPAEVIDYTIERRGFPSTSPAGDIDYKQFIASRKKTEEKARETPQKENKKTSATSLADKEEEEIDLSAQFTDTVDEISKAFERLQGNPKKGVVGDADKAIVAYKAYVNSIQE